MAPIDPKLPALFAPPECAADLCAWHLAGPRLTVVAKIAFSLAPGPAGALGARPEIVERDRHHERAPARSLEAASDLAPLLPGAEISIVGSAWAPSGAAVGALPVSLAVATGAGAGLLYKRVDVVGDRRQPGAPPQPFARMPLVWERARGGPENPVGVEGLRQPNLVDPRDPSRPAGLGPIAPGWPARRSRLGGASPRAFEDEPLALAPGFDFGFFFSAPADQRLRALSGDEWLRLEGLHPAHPRLELRLPAARLGLRTLGPSGEVRAEQRMVPDRLVVNTDRALVTLSYRCGIALDWTAPSDVRLTIGLARGDAALVFADPSDPRAARGRRAPTRPVATGASPPTVLLPDPPAPAGAPTPGTQAVDPEAAALAALPFEELLARSRARTGNPDKKQGLPFAQGGAPPPTAAPVAPADGVLETAALDPDALASAAAQRAAPPPAPAIAPPAIAPPAIAPPAIAPPAVPAPSHAATVGLDPEAARLAALPFEELAALARAGEATRSTAPLDPDAIASARAPFTVAEARAPRAPAPLEGLPFLDLRRPSDEARRPPPDATPATDAVRAPRTGEHVPCTTDAPLALGAIPWRIEPGQCVHAVVVKASFALVEGGPARLADEPEVLCGDQYDDDDLSRALVSASDLALLKREVDVLVRGDVYAAGGEATVGKATLALKGAHGQIDRALAVFGARTWSGGALALAPSAPQPFRSLRLTFDGAFGGPGYAANPLGMGRGETRGERRLPHFEPWGRLVASPSDTPTPACFGPVHPQARAPWGAAGTYDAAWLAERWPYLPDDFDFVLLQAAQPEQRLPRADGDESWALSGMHPTRPTQRGTLAGLRARVFAVDRDPTLAFREIPVRLDTITFEPAAERVHLVWRGLVVVTDDDAPELARFFATLEPLAGPALELPQIEARCRAVLEPPAEAAPPAPPPRPPAANDSADDAADEAIRRSVLERIAAVEASLPPSADGAEPLPPASPEQIEAALRSAGASDEDVAALLSTMRGPTTDPPPPADPAKRAVAEDRLARGEPLAGLDLRGADLTGLDLRGVDLGGASLEGARLGGVDLSGATLTGARLARADLSRANLSRVKAAGVDLFAAALGEALAYAADLAGAKLDQIDATGADLTQARLDGASFVGARLDGAKLDGATAEGADFSEASLERATLREAKLSRARLYDVAASGASFDRADLFNARGDGAVLARASLRDVKADESAWEGADLSGATFTGASLVGAGFLRARCGEAVMSGCDLRAARMRRADLTGARFVRANLMEAALDRAVLDKADLRGANLHACSLDKTRAEGVRLDAAIVTRTPWAGRRA